MNNVDAKRRRRFISRRVLILLVTLVLLIVGAILFGAPILLRILDFAPRGDVNTFWDEIAPEGTEQVNALPALLSTRPATRVIVVPTPTVSTSTPQPTAAHRLMPTATPRILLTTPAPEQGTDEPVQEATASETPGATPSPTATSTAVDPYADLFATATVPDRIRIFSPGYLDLTLNGHDTFASHLLVGADTDDRVLGIAEFDEAAISELCAVYFNNCRDPRFRIDKVDFRPKGMLVYGSINLGLFWQQVGVALLLDDEKRHLALAGIVWNDEVFEVPRNGRFVAVLDQLADRGNSALGNLNVLTGTYTLSVEEMYFDENRFIVILRDGSTGASD